MRLISISSYIIPILRQPGLEARVDSVYAEVVNLATVHGNFLSLVSERIGNGPLNAVVDPEGLLAVVHRNDVVTGDGRQLQLGRHWRVSLTEASVWDAQPSFQSWSRWPQLVRSNLERLSQDLPLEAPPASLAAAPAYHTQGAFGSRPAMALIQSQAWELTEGLRKAYRQGNLQWIQLYASRLAGLGPGLTPAGDDWLAGWLIGLRGLAVLREDDDGEPWLPVDVVAATVLQSADGQTSPLSLAFLHAASAGMTPQPWHTLIEQLSSADSVALHEAAAEVMRWGGTSGADMLAGFLAAFQTG
jgi:hypothetical protein